MADIHFIGGEKGGVGKSLTARVLAQYFIDKQLPFVGFDTDRSHGALLRFYADYASPVSMDRAEALDAIVEAAAAEPGRRVLVDLAAQTHDTLAQWMEEASLLAVAAEEGIQLHYWHVMDAGKDSADLLKKLLDRFGNGLQYVLVRNQIRGTDFSVLDKSGQEARAIELGAKVVNLKKLSESALLKIDDASSSFWKASVAGGGLGLLDRQRVKTWLADTYREFEKAGL
ncbi:mobilization protein [Pseudorhodoferax sp. Leaf267]|uniref:mobilization protein n=1 Tax=Pseudorhodoferax sp. Leaf267 TaxID=1736316 RepID=UPI0006FE6236|nr:mobilization protein [Pseudorhodoferax sp. Leaf267]KQP14986.1 mobilization protein [Pseudorhodoferax sp. Leaf267]